MMRLREFAAVIRSKNAAPFLITLDAFFSDAEAYLKVRRSGVLTADAIAVLYMVDVATVEGPYWNDKLLAFKVTVPKVLCQPGTTYTDQFGSSQHVPLANITIPSESAS